MAGTGFCHELERGDFLPFVDAADDQHGPRLAMAGFWEAWVTLALARYLQPGFHCVNVGGNYGYDTLLMAAACGREGRVLACEPNPLLVETYLPANLAIYGCPEQVRICRCALGDHQQPSAPFVLHHGDYGTSSLAPWDYPHPRAETIHVPMTTLDQLCADWDRLNLVKIDAEGAEALIWDGMQQMLRRFPQAAVVVELHLQRDPRRAASFLHHVQRSGYSLRCVNYNGGRARRAGVAPFPFGAEPADAACPLVPSGGGATVGQAVSEHARKPSHRTGRLVSKPRLCCLARAHGTDCRCVLSPSDG